MAVAAASYADINTILNDGPTRDRCGVACLRSAYNVANEDTGTTNHSNRLAWAKATLADPVTAAQKALRFVLAAYSAANPTLDLAAIQAGLTDAVLQNYVDASLAVFAA